MTKLHKRHHQHSNRLPSSSSIGAVTAAASAVLDSVDDLLVDDLNADNGDIDLDDLDDPEGRGEDGLEDKANVAAAISETRTTETQAANSTPSTAIPNSVTSALSVEATLKANEVGARAEQLARRAVESFYADQAEAKLFDVLEGNRILLTLQPDDIATYRAAWEARNSTGHGKIPFSEYLSSRIRLCRDHTAVRAVYVRDDRRLHIETLFDEAVLSDDDLVVQLERRLRPLVESPREFAPDGVLKLKPLDPMLIELVVGWFPDKSPAEALGDWLLEAGLEKAGLR